MDIDQMRGFLETARERSFTRAAEKLFLTQPAVSLQIKALETELGTPLFERRGKRVLLTQAGQVLFLRAEEILNLVARAQQDIAALDDLKAGRLCIGTSDTNCAYVLPPVIQAFRAAYPGVDIRLTDRMSAEVVRLVMEGHVDFGLATLPVGETRVVTEPLFFREDVLICPEDHPLGKRSQVLLEETVGFPWLMLERGSTSRNLLDGAFYRAGLHVHVAMELGSVEVIKRFVEIGMGVALVPKVAAEEEVISGRLVAVKVVHLPVRQVGVVRRLGGHLGRAAEVFLVFLKRHVAENFSVPEQTQV